MTWNQFFQEGEIAVEIVRKGLAKRGFNVRLPMITQFNTDEDIPIYSQFRQRLFWISVKSVNCDLTTLEQVKQYHCRGWMCGEVESKQWLNPPAVIIWYCLPTSFAWGTIVPQQRLSTKWLIFPQKHGLNLDTRKSKVTNKNRFLYPSYCVQSQDLISKEEIIAYLHQLVEQNT